MFPIKIKLSAFRWRDKRLGKSSSVTTHTVFRLIIDISGFPGPRSKPTQKTEHTLKKNYDITHIGIVGKG